MHQYLNVEVAITNLKKSTSDASAAFDASMMGDEWASPEWDIEKCFLQLLALVEVLGLPELYKITLSEYTRVKESKLGFLGGGTNPNGEPYPIVLSEIRKLLGAIEQFSPSEQNVLINKDIMQILRDIHYTITNKALFSKVPQDENEVHLRIEGILKCVFPDLRHKPSLTKPIKNFEPDTGIPSIGTLIEYKFLCREADIPTLADQVLADTRGYFSKDWRRFIYVIYETNRFRTEYQWVELLRQSGVPEDTSIIVLSGEPPKKRKKNLSKSSIVSGEKN